MILQSFKGEEYKLENFQGYSMSVNKYEKLNRIGEGTYGVVYRAKLGAKIVALKRIRMNQDSDGFPVSSLREISILKKLNHENVLRVIDVVVGTELDTVFMVMEYCEQDLGYLMDHVFTDPKNALTLPQIKCIIYQLLKGVAYLHDHYIIHRDLKLSNLLLTGKGILKIADFGLARTVSNIMTPKVVTIWYRSPELLLGEERYDETIDVWSIGCIVCEFLLNEPLLPGDTELKELQLIWEMLGSPRTKELEYLKSLPNGKMIPTKEFDGKLERKLNKWGYQTRRFVESMLTYRPMDRMDCRELQRHAFFKDSPRKCSPDQIPTYPEYRNKS
jgi:cyclin-dependent kinase 10